MAPESMDLFFEKIVEGDDVTRRSALKRLSAGAAMMSGSAAFLAACGGVEGTSNNDANQDTDVSHPKTAIGTLVVSNWPLYIDEGKGGKPSPTITGWQKANDAKMKYLEDYNDNEEFYAKVRQELENDQGIGRDLIMPTDWMAARWIEQGYAIPKDKNNVPNEKNLIPTLRKPPYDANRNYTLPWQSGITGIGYNPKKCGRKLTSVNDLFDPKFKGRVTMFSEWRDSAGLVLLGMGKDSQTASKDDYLEAINKIGEESSKGQIRRFTGNDYTTDLAKGNLWACVAWSGDLVQLKAENPDLEFLIPEEGAVTWSDNMLIPQKAKSPYGAETFMNYVYDPEIAANIAEYVNYFCPVEGVKEILTKRNPELANNQLIFPDKATTDQLRQYPNLGAAADREVTAAMQKVTGS